MARMATRYRGAFSWGAPGTGRCSTGCARSGNGSGSTNFARVLGSRFGRLLGFGGLGAAFCDRVCAKVREASAAVAGAGDPPRNPRRFIKRLDLFSFRRAETRHGRVCDLSRALFAAMPVCDLLLPAESAFEPILDNEARTGVEDIRGGVLRTLVEVEHIIDGVGEGIEGTGADPFTVQPIVLDEAQHGGLVGQGVVHEIVARPGRDDQKRQTRSIAATALRMQRA